MESKLDFVSGRVMKGYIEKRLSKGHSARVINDGLIKMGWPKKMVEGTSRKDYSIYDWMKMAPRLMDYKTTVVLLIIVLIAGAGFLFINKIEPIYGRTVWLPEIKMLFEEGKEARGFYAIGAVVLLALLLAIGIYYYKKKIGKESSIPSLESKFKDLSDTAREQIKTKELKKAKKNYLRLCLIYKKINNSSISASVDKDYYKRLLGLYLKLSKN